jgi:hypothetical protein
MVLTSAEVRAALWLPACSDSVYFGLILASEHSGHSQTLGHFPMDRSNADTKPSAINRLACGTEGARRNASSCGTGRLASRILVCADLFMFNIFKGTVVPGAWEGMLYHTSARGKR